MSGNSTFLTKMSGLAGRGSGELASLEACRDEEAKGGRARQALPRVDIDDGAVGALLYISLNCFGVYDEIKAAKSVKNRARSCVAS